MSVTVKIPTQLRAVTGGEAETDVDGATTVGEVLDGLYDRYDGLRERIAEDGDLRRFVNVYVGGEDIRFLDGLDTPVEDGDEVTILPVAAGGASVTVLEKEQVIGGCARSFHWKDMVHDMGPHRWHSKNDQLIAHLE